MLPEFVVTMFGRSGKYKFRAFQLLDNAIIAGINLEHTVDAWRSHEAR
jgi:hypothetical protein